MSSLHAIPNAFRSGHIVVDGHKLSYLQFGNGRLLVLAFHGYGGNAEMFHFLEHPDYTVLSIELPFHGQSEGNGEVILSRAGMVKMACELMEQYGVKETGLVGFSLGARVCLCFAEDIPHHIRNIVLIAPDGIRNNRFYRMLTRTALGRSLFRGFVKRGEAHLKIFAFLHRIGLLDRHKYRFALQYIRTPQSRKLLLDIWMVTSKLVPHMHTLKDMIHKRHMPVHILVGRHDQVIPMKNAFVFKGHSDYIHVHVFERGHNLLEYEEIKGTVFAWLFRLTQPAKKI